MMKKTIIASMVLAVGLLASPVMASEQNVIDYDSMSTEELVALRDEINAQIADRGGDNVIGQGTYVAWTDIKASKFKVKCYNSDSVAFYLYDSEEKYDNLESSDMLLLHSDDECGLLNLKDGQVVSVSFGAAIIEEVSPSWAPEE